MKHFGSAVIKMEHIIQRHCPIPVEESGKTMTKVYERLEDAILFLLPD
jgi:hypothetical protein